MKGKPAMKKWKIAGLLVSQIILTYAVFIVCIHQPKNIYRQVGDVYGSKGYPLSSTEARLRSILLQYVEHPTTVTIIETKKAPKEDTNRTGLALLKPDDVEFLYDEQTVKIVWHEKSPRSNHGLLLSLITSWQAGNLRKPSGISEIYFSQLQFYHFHSL
jgi:hypothetical protein